MSVIQAYHILVKENKPETVGPTVTNLPRVNTEKMRPSVYTFLKGIKIKTELSDFKILVTVGPGPKYTRTEDRRMRIILGLRVPCIFPFRLKIQCT